MMRLETSGTTLYEGAPVSVPAVGDAVVVDGSPARVEARTWTLTADLIVVQLLLAPVAYTA